MIRKLRIGESSNKFSEKHRRRLKESKHISENYEVSEDLANRVANELHDMDWRDWLSDSYDTYEDEWTAFVDYIYDELYSNPCDVVELLVDSNASEDLIDEVALNAADEYGIYCRDFNTGIPVILKFDSYDEASEASDFLPSVAGIEDEGELIGVGDYTATVLDDYNCKGYIEINRREIDMNLHGHAFLYQHDLFYIINGDDWFDIV